MLTVVGLQSMTVSPIYLFWSENFNFHEEPALVLPSWFKALVVSGYGHMTHTWLIRAVEKKKTFFPLQMLSCEDVNTKLQRGHIGGQLASE